MFIVDYNIDYNSLIDYLTKQSMKRSMANQEKLVEGNGTAYLMP